MKKLVTIIILCLGCMGILGAQNVWKPINSNAPLLGAASNGDLFAMAGYSGLLRSQDEGETWEQVNGNYMHQCIAFSPQGRIFVFPSNYMYLQYSDDGGDTWQETTMMSSCAMNDVAGLYAPSNDIVVVWSTNGETYWTVDGGATWSFAGLELDEESQVGDMIVNAEGDVYVSTWSYSDGDAGIFHSTLSDMQNWELVAAEGINVKDMAFDPEGNVVACGWMDEGSIGFQHTPGFYLFDGTSLAIGDGGIVYTPHFMGLQAVLSYSTDHGEHFTEIGEHLPLVDIAPGGENARLFKGADNHLYFDGGGEYWKTVRDADHILENFLVDNTRWSIYYQNLYLDWAPYIQIGIKGDTIADGTTYHKVIKCTSYGTVIDGDCFGGIRVEADGKWYFRLFSEENVPQYLSLDMEPNTERLVYDFSLSVCDRFNFAGYEYEEPEYWMSVFDIDEIEINGSIRKRLWFDYDCEEGDHPHNWNWIEGIGSNYGLLYSIQAFPLDGSSYHLGEVYQDGELIYSDPYFHNYIPLIDEANNRQKWNVVYIGVTPNYPNDYHTEIQSIRDNITLDGVDYKLVWKEDVYDSKRIAGAVREEDKKVYFRRKIEQSYQDEVLLYDFNLTVGDTVTVNWMGQQLMVLEESEVEVNGIMRRQLGLASYSDEAKEVEEYWIEGVGSTFGFLNSGSEGMGGAFIYLLCYHENGNLIWDNEEFDECVMNSDEEPATFAPQGAEWYFHVWSQGPITEPPFYYIKKSVTGIEEVQGHTCSVIDGFELVYEEDGVVYWYNPSDDVFTVLYDFNAEVGDSWYCEVGDYYPCHITVDSVGSVTWNGQTYRTQYVTGYIEEWSMPIMNGRIIEGIGYEKGLFPEVIIDGPEYEYMRCYLVDGEMLYHEGDYDCDYVPQTGSPCWDGSVANAYEGGDGTEENPYQIATPQQLALLAQQTNNGTGGDAYYILTDDICLNVENDSIDWAVIGKETSQNLPIYFTGVFDGNGHTIEKMIIRENHIDAGLFGHTRGAVIKNLRVVDAAIQVGSDVGIIVGQAYNTSIINCTVQNSTISRANNSYNYVGGLVGGYYPTDNASDTVYIKDCVSEVRFMNPERFFIAGGIVGRCMTMSTDGGFAVIENCENRNDVGGYDYVGGIMGSADNSHNGESLALIIKGCRNYGNISSITFCSGGIVGYNWGVQMIGCLNMGEVVAGEGNSNVAVGGVAGLLKESIMVECVNKGDVRSESNSGSEIGGLVGFNDESVIASSYNVGTVSAPYNVPANATEAIGGIVGNSTGRIFNVYNAGALTVPETPSGSEMEGYGHVLGLGDVAEHYLNCYWLEQDSLPACGNMELPGSSSFIPTMYFSYWILNEPQYGYMDFLTALNFGAEVVLDSVPEYPYLTTWVADTENTNQGLPILASIPEPNDTIQSGDLLYSIISVNPPCVSVIGHVDGEDAQGELVIPETVTYMGFDYTVTEVGDGAFQRCSGLTGTLTFPTTMRIIGVSAFAQCTGFTELVLPEGLLEIREMAFRDCTGFTGTLDFPETVTHIKYGSFNRCTGFSGDLVLPNSVREVGNTQDYSYFYEQGIISTFADCFDHLVLSQSLDTIGYGCFSNCESLTGHLVMPEGLKAIHDDAFYLCFGLTGLTLNDSLVHIGRMAFEGCGFTGTLAIPENVELASFAFSQCNGIEALALPHHLSFVESGELGYVFGYCRGLVTLDIPEGWTETGDYTFTGCYNLQQVHLPESLTTINTNTFSYCTNLAEINIPESVTEIGDAAFMSCVSLTNVVLPSGLLRLGGSAFSYCSNLAGDFIVPDLVERIESNTFHSCANLNRIVLGNSVNYVVDDAFASTQLEALVLKSMTPPELERNPYNPVWNIPADQLIIVPCGTLEAYQNSESWAGFTNIMEDCGSGLVEFQGSEWYYEIQNENGSITYQHLEYVADTTVNHKDVQIIIRTNTLYDKGEHSVVTREYVYEEDGVVYWWNKDLQEFTVLYNLDAQPGDSWVIKVGTENITMQVNAVDLYYYDGRLFRMLQVSDENDVFSGTIVCGIGHLTSFFPERLMTRGKGYRVEGMRCYWRDDELFFKYGDEDCDAVYKNYHFGLDEQEETAFAIYPNPTHGVLFVETQCFASHPTQTYRITNLMGQTLMTGNITAETQQINVSNLPQGMYFISIGDTTQRFVVR